MDNLVKAAKLLKKDLAQSHENFKDDVCAIYVDFLLKYITNEYGAPSDFYLAMQNGQEGRDANYKFSFKEKINNFVHTIERCTKLAERASVVPVPDDDCFKEIYDRYKHSNTSPIEMQEITDEFLIRLDELVRQIDDMHDEYNPCPSDSGVIIVKKQDNQPQEEFENYIGEKITSFALEFLDDRGIYSKLLSALLDNEEQKETLSNKIDTFIMQKAGRLRDVAKRQTQAPLPDIAYFRKLCREYRNSPKSLEEIKVKFIAAIDELSRQIDEYDKLN